MNQYWRSWMFYGIGSLLIGISVGLNKMAILGFIGACFVYQGGICFGRHLWEKK